MDDESQNSTRAGLQQMREAAEFRADWVRWLARFSVVVGMFVATISLYSAFSGFAHRPVEPNPHYVAAQKDIALIQANAEQASKAIQEVQRALITNPPNVENKNAAALADLNIRMADLSARLQALEQAINASPEKALAIPILRKDLETVQRSQVDDRTETRTQLDRIYDLYKWCFGLLFPLALSTIALAITTAFKGSKEAKKEA